MASDVRLLGALLVLVAAPASAQQANPFDGTWNTILSCTNFADALGYSFQFSSVVKNGVLHGDKGVRGEAGWLELNGQISADGTATLYVSGIVGAAPYVVGQRPGGTPYGYHIEATFSDRAGGGKRVEGRPCSVSFDR
jgi:hypothetical protein